MSAHTKLTQCISFHIASENLDQKIITVSEFGIVTDVIIRLESARDPNAVDEEITSLQLIAGDDIRGD